MIVKTSRGFTLIELLVVISIIGILASIGLANFLNARGKARDAQRRSDLKTISTALEAYYNDNGAYPSVYTMIGGWNWVSSEPGDPVPNLGDNWIAGLVPKYIKKLPRDPKGGAGLSICGGSWKRAYLYISDGNEYALLSHCAPESPLNNTKDPYYDPVRPNHAWKQCMGETGCNW